MEVVEGLSGVASAVLDLPRDDSNSIPEEGGPSVFDLAESLQHDIGESFRARESRPILFLLDTYELITGVEKGSYPEERDSWLEPLFGICGTCWMAFGRGRVRETIGFEYQEMAIFNVKDTENMLLRAGIRGVHLVEAVHTASRGLPLFVAVFIEAHLLARVREEDIAIGDVSSSEGLVATFLRYFEEADSAAAETLCACACLERWDGGILKAADPHFESRLTTISKIECLSFVDVYEDGVSMMHEVAAKAIRGQSKNTEKRRAMDSEIWVLGNRIEESLASEGWGEYGWWKSAEWLCYLRRQSTELQDGGALAWEGEERGLALARALGKLGLHKDAISIERKVLAARRGRGCDQREVWEAARVLGISYSDAGRHEDAVACHECMLREIEESGDADGRMAALVLRELAVAESLMAERDKNAQAHEIALEHKRAAVERLIETSQFPNPETDDSDVLNALKNWAVTLWDLGRFEESFAVEKRLVRSCLKSRGLRNPETLMAVDNMAGSIFSIGCEKGDESVIRKALLIHKAVQRIRSSCLSATHVHLALSAYNIADTYRELRDYQSAWVFAQEARRLYLDWYGGRHPDVDDSHELIAQIEDEAAMAGVDISI